jgi:hypothetical protein
LRTHSSLAEWRSLRSAGDGPFDFLPVIPSAPSRKPADLESGRDHFENRGSRFFRTRRANHRGLSDCCGNIHHEIGSSKSRTATSDRCVDLAPLFTSILPALPRKLSTSRTAASEAAMFANPLGLSQSQNWRKWSLGRPSCRSAKIRSANGSSRCIVRIGWSGPQALDGPRPNSHSHSPRNQIEFQNPLVLAILDSHR